MWFDLILILAATAPLMLTRPTLCANRHRQQIADRSDELIRRRLPCEQRQQPRLVNFGDL
jgi:hypothetical protein